MDNKSGSLVTKPSWADIHSDLLDMVLQNLPFIDRFHSKEVCKTWRLNAKIHISSFLETFKSQPPVLMIPSDEISDYVDSLCIVNIEEKRLWRYNKDLPRKYDEEGFIGSSKGWLVFKDGEDEKLFLFNPFLDVEVKTNLPVKFYTSKFALWSFPILSDYNNYGIVTICEQNNIKRIVYAKGGEVNWSQLGGCMETSYCDIVCCNHLVYALSERCYLESWDFRSIIPTKRTYLKPDLPQESVIEFENFDELLYRSQRYLIVTNGEILLVQRFVGYHVRNDGVVVFEEDIEDHENEDFSFRYLTMAFYVFNLDFGTNKWVRVEDLGDKVILLGGNESVLVQSGDFEEFEKNSIYFTDDFWEGMDPYYEYSGHDNGIYRLNDNTIELLSDSLRIQPTPFWIIPSSM